MFRRIFSISIPCVLLSLAPVWARRPPRSEIRSVSVAKGVIRVRAHPRIQSTVVGRIAGPGRFAVLEVRSPGRGCASLWYRIGPNQWVCSGWLVPHAEPATGLPDHVLTTRFGPWVLGLGRRTPWYPSLGRLARDAPVRLRGTVGFEVDGLSLVGRLAVYHVRGGGWVAQRDVRPFVPTGPLGVTLSRSSRLPLAFVISPRATVALSRKGHIQDTDQVLRRYQVLTVGAPKTIDGRCYRPLAAKPNRLVACEDLAVAEPPPPPPPGLDPDEPWVDIDGRAHVLYARRGAEVVRVMLVSLGRSTPSGLFSVREKWLSLTLNSQRTRKAWYLHNVPFVIFFWKGFALHAAYWHDAFGVHESQGCINLSLADARWIFRFLEPRLPSGFVYLKPYRRLGSPVRIRNTRRHVRTRVARILARRARAARTSSQGLKGNASGPGAGRPAPETTGSGRPTPK